MSSFEYLKIAWYYFSMWGKRLMLFTLVITIILVLFSHFLVQDRTNIQVHRPRSVALERQKMYELAYGSKKKLTQQQKTIIQSYRGLLCWGVGEVCTHNPNDVKKFYPKSAAGVLGTMLTYVIMNPPASGVVWLSDSLENAGFTPKTYAAEGIGFSALKPIINLWKVFRDLSYMLLVIVLVIIGFMIMFRMKLNPQTVINVENALPKVVVSMILITFSFAIAGFMIDLMYVIIAVVISLISSNGAFYDVGLMQNTYLNGNGLSLWNGIFSNPANINGAARGLNGSLGIFANWANINWLGKSVIMNALTALPGFVSIPINTVVNMLISFGLTKFIFGGLFEAFGKALNDVGIATGILGFLPQLLTFFWTAYIATIMGFSYTPTVIVPFLAGMAIFFTVLFLFFRIFLMLFRSYLQILFMIIIAPLILIFEAIPGKSTFSFWFKNLAAEIMTFPLVISILTIGFVLANQLSVAGGFWTPPFLNTLDPNLLPIFIGMGVIFMTPDLVKLAKEQLFGVKGLPINFGLGSFFAGAGAAGGGAVSLLGTVSTINMGGAAFFGQGWMESAGKNLFKGGLPFLKNRQAKTDIPTDDAIKK